MKGTRLPDETSSIKIKIPGRSCNPTKKDVQSDHCILFTMPASLLLVHSTASPVSSESTVLPKKVKKAVWHNAGVKLCLDKSLGLQASFWMRWRCEFKIKSFNHYYCQIAYPVHSRSDLDDRVQAHSPILCTPVRAEVGDGHEMVGANSWAMHR